MSVLAQVHPAPRTHASAAFRASAEVSWAGDRSCRLRAACPREGIGAAQRAGQSVPVGHVPDQVRRVGCGHPGRGDDRHRVGRRAEPGLGCPDHRDTELGVRMPAQAGPPGGVPSTISRPSTQLESSRTVRSGRISRTQNSPSRQGGTT